jgi:hypothetical protein
VETRAAAKVKVKVDKADVEADVDEVQEKDRILSGENRPRMRRRITTNVSSTERSIGSTPKQSVGIPRMELKAT